MDSSFQKRYRPGGLLELVFAKMRRNQYCAKWTYSGRIFDASEALDRNFIRSVHKESDLLGDARKLAAEFANQTSAVSVAMTRQMMWKMLGADHPMEAHKIDSRGVYFTGKSADAHEGVQSFLEKSPLSLRIKSPKTCLNFFHGGRKDNSTNK